MSFGRIIYAFNEKFVELWDFKSGKNLNDQQVIPIIPRGDLRF